MKADLNDSVQFAVLGDSGAAVLKRKVNMLIDIGHHQDSTQCKAQNRRNITRPTDLLLDT